MEKWWKAKICWAMAFYCVLRLLMVQCGCDGGTLRFCTSKVVHSVIG